MLICHLCGCSYWLLMDLQHQCKHYYTVWRPLYKRWLHRQGTAWVINTQWPITDSSWPLGMWLVHSHSEYFWESWDKAAWTAVTQLLKNGNWKLSKLCFKFVYHSFVGINLQDQINHLLVVSLIQASNPAWWAPSPLHLQPVHHLPFHLHGMLHRLWSCGCICYLSSIEIMILQQDETRKNLITATAASSCIACFVMGAFANMPLAIAPGMGLNAYFTYNVVGYCKSLIWA